MIRPIILSFAALAVLAACDPMADVERLSEVELADGAVASIAPGPGETEAATPVLAELLSGEAETVGADVVPAVAPAPASGGGFWSRLAAGAATPVSAVANPDAPDAAQIAPGQTLPYGEIATVCGQPEAALGTPIATQSGYTLYDTAPTTITPRTHFIMGFADRCARQFTAALAMFGDVGTHEVLRYEPSEVELPYSETDIAYEEIKASFCGVQSGQPCGSRLEQLGARTAFVTVYENFGTNPSWADILIYDGAVVAMDFKNDDRAVQVAEGIGN